MSLIFGSVYGFWCFSFERYNGILGRYHTNNHDITIQVMRKLVSCQQINSNFDHSDHLESFFSNSEVISQYLLLNNKTTVGGEDLEFKCEQPLSLGKMFPLSKGVSDELLALFESLYPFQNIRIRTFSKRYSRIDLFNETIAVKGYRGTFLPYSKVFAKFPVGGDYSKFVEMEQRPAVVEDLLEVGVIREVDGKEKLVFHLIAECNFFKCTRHINFYGSNNPLKLWDTQFEVSLFVPVKFIRGRYVSTLEEIPTDTIRNKTICNTYNVVIPLPSKSII